MKLLSGFVIAILLLQALAEASSINRAANALATVTVDEGSNVVALDSKHHPPMKINCSSACSRRCKKASRKKRCTRACKSCCMRCHCVPPGTYGHTNACPCYARLKTHGNKLKTFVSTAMSDHIGIARASIIVAVGSWRHAVAPLAARLACPDAHLMPRCLAAPVTTLPIAVCIMIEYIYIYIHTAFSQNIDGYLC
ncbi:hypothetical protein FH972_018185 [Carpinus fangiana]|uniref:Gibberellin-regulated protein n=1 Tax=Carpinus fangiana TaxID=176857 RepID=A0A5N6RQ66_9ROSI|nr:hypothetical protein FH972_018185 [Carpinus fangiana]